MPNHWIIWSSDDSSFKLIKPSITNNCLISIRCSLTITETLQTIGLYQGCNRIINRIMIDQLAKNWVVKETQYLSIFWNPNIFSSSKKVFG